MSRLAAVAVLLLMGTVEFVAACQICIPFPRKSAADFLLESDAVVLAREDPDRPFHFAATEVLKGDPGEEAIDLFVDSSTRRLLAVHPEKAVVLVKRTVDGEPEWKRVGTADTDLGPIVSEILKSAAAWETKPERRIEFFAEFLGHENPQVRNLAHLEIARAPYREIKKLGGVLSRAEIHDFLKNFRYVEWHPLYILLLAQSGNSKDREWISESMESAARFGSTMRLAAWATAFVELEEEAAIAFVEMRYFGSRNRKPEELDAVFQALSVHGTNGHTHLRDRIVRAYGVLIANHPLMALRVVDDLVAWNRSDLNEMIGGIASDPPQELDFQAVLKLRRYLRGTEKSAADLQSARP